MESHLALRSRAHTRTVIFEYVEGFYNRRRLHSSLDYCPPDEHGADTFTAHKQLGNLLEGVAHHDAQRQANQPRAL